MLKFDNIIRNLSLEEKLKLITSDDYCNKTIKNYELPTFKIASNLNKISPNTYVPTYTMLGQTWNERLVEGFAQELALNSIIHNQRILFGVPTGCKEDNEDYFGAAKYLVGKMAKSFIKGIENGGAFSCLDKFNTPNSLDDIEYRTKLILPSEIACVEGNPRAMVSEGVENSHIINDELHYKGLKICEVYDPSDLIRSINNENHITIAYGLDVEDICIDAIRKYKVASVELHKNVISKSTFDSLVRNGEILNEEKLDFIVDSLLSHLVDYLEDLQKAGDVISGEVLKAVADESIVLLKNDGILPIHSTQEFTLVGELANSPVLNDCNGDVNLEYETPLDVINDTQLNLINFAYGYHSELDDSNRLIEEAINECRKTNLAVVYVGASLEYYEDNYFLPQNQLDLLMNLSNNEIGVIAVVCTNKPIDMSFTDYCRAVILTGPNTRETIYSTIEILSGKLSPSGRLTMNYPYVFDTDGNCSDEIKYPLGYGLSYSSFEYRKFNVKHNGITFISENTGSYAAKDVVQLYVSKITNDIETSKELKGFVKYDLAAHDYKKLEIEFDDKTFRSYNLEKMCYCVEQGVYKIYLCKNENDVIFETEISLSGVLDDKNAYSYEIEESSDVFEDIAQRFVDDNESKEAFYHELRGMSYGKKLAISIMVYIYLAIIMIITIVLALKSDKKLLIIGIASALMLIFTIGFVLYIVKSKRFNEKYKKLLTKSPINDMVNELKSFDINSNEQFEKEEKTLEEELAEIVEEEITDNDVIEEVIEQQEEIVEEEMIEEEEHEYIECDFDIKDDELQYSNDLDFNKLCYSFNSYCLKNGLIIEQASIRLLISSIFSSKLVFIRSTRMDLLPKLSKLLSQFICADEKNYNVLNVQNNSLVWQYEDNNFKLTEFVKHIYQSLQYKKRYNIISLENVEITNMLDYFKDYYDYCSNPNENHSVQFGKNEIILPKNIMFIAIPNKYEYLEAIPTELALYSSSIEVQIRENEIIPEDEIQLKYYDYSSYVDLIRLEKEKYYLPEEAWKKLDDFEEALDSEEKFRIENKTVLQIENFATVALLSGSDMLEILDFVLASKIIPTVKQYGPYLNGSSDNVVTKSIERYFEADTIANALRALKKAD